MNCKTIKDEGCERCDEKRLCRTYLELKNLNEYDDTTPIGYSKRMSWDNEMPLIATIKRNPILGIVIETNVMWSSIPDEKQIGINNWSQRIGNRKLRDALDFVELVNTF